MALKVDSIYDIYLLDGSANNITLKSFIGDIGQTSKTDVTITDASGNDNQLFTGYNGSIPNTIIGTNANLTGYRLTIGCIITVTSASSNYCDEAITINGGTQNKNYLLYDDTLTSGQSTTLLCIIRFL